MVTNFDNEINLVKDLDVEITKKKGMLNKKASLLLNNMLGEKNEIIIPEELIDEEITFINYNNHGEADVYIFTGFKLIGQKPYVCGYCRQEDEEYEDSFNNPFPLSYLDWGVITELVLSLINLNLLK